VEEVIVTCCKVLSWNFPQEIRMTMKILSQDSQSMGWESNLRRSALLSAAKFTEELTKSYAF
jgi:hypothetical protein